MFASTGQYDWFSAQVLYCLIRFTRPDTIIEVSTSSGYSTCIQACALERNQHGVIHTFELEPAFGRSAQRALAHFSLTERVCHHLGDARVVCDDVPTCAGTRLLFLDSLHTQEFARWFIRRWVNGSPEGTLFHAHDCMPASARVRFHGGPPWPRHKFDWLRQVGRRMAGRPSRAQLGHIERQSFGPSSGNALPCTDGVFTTEALLLNRLVESMAPEHYAFLHALPLRYPQLCSDRFDHQAIRRENSAGKPMEWNETLWLDASALCSAYTLHENGATES